jgi:hypothetical protein
MTLILTCLAHEHIVQVADRRLTMPNGALYDDDTNKAVFYCGRVAVAYTGLALVEGKPTAEWIGLCMKDAAETETAMNRVAERAEHYFQQTNGRDKRLAVVATGWGTLRGAHPLRPFICVASNFMTDSWEWRPSAQGRMVVRTTFLDENSSHLVFAAGQNLTRGEVIYLNRLVRRAVEHGATARALVRLLGNMVQSVAYGRDDRAARVGRGMIIHLLSRKALVEGRAQIMTPLTPDAHSFIYVSPEGRTNPFQGVVIACNGALLTGFGGGTIPPGGKGMIRTEMEASARRQPIRVSSDETWYSSPCPFCAAEARKRGLPKPPQIVEGDLPLTDMEAWIYCHGATGHLLLIQREGRTEEEK